MTVDAGPASKELDAFIEHYQRNRDRWAWGYYAARGSVIFLGASIPVMTTLDSLPKTAIAIAGGLIVVIEGVSRLSRVPRSVHRGQGLVQEPHQGTSALPSFGAPVHGDERRA